MPSASNNNQSNTKLVKQTSVNSVNSGGTNSTSGGGKCNKNIETTTKSNATSNNSETSSIKTAKENTNNVVATAQQQQNNSKNWETSSAAGNVSTPLIVNKDAGNDALNPMKLTFTTIEHKIRNLEKRKTKLEAYRELQASGKELSSDQRAAVAKYDAVMSTLEFARDLVKQMQQFTKDAEKEQKKQARKDLIAKAQAETIKIREVLIIQNILSCFTDEAVRNDFLAGENGAAKLENNEFEILEKFCLDVQTRRPETAEDVPFATSAQKAAEIFSMTIDARPKQYGETTYENVKRIFHRIQESDYLDKIYLIDVPEPEIKNVDADLEEENGPNIEEAGESNNHEPELNALEENMEKLDNETDNNMIPSVHASPIVENGALIGQQQQQSQQTQPNTKEQLAMQKQVALTNLPHQAVQPIIPAPMAPPAAAVPSFQPASQAQHSSATTPVHVAMYHASLQQPAPQHLQQMPNAAALMAGVPPNASGQLITSLPTQTQQVPIQNVTVAGTAHSNSQQQQQQQQQRHLLNSSATQPVVATSTIAMHNTNAQQQALPPGHFNHPTPVHAVEQNYFKHQPAHAQQHPPQHQHQQYMQQIRPLAEVIGSGNFYFLQDSELDSPDLSNQGVQGVPQATMVFEQQPQQQQTGQQNIQNKNAQSLMHEPNQQQLQQQLPSTQQQQQQQHQTATQTPIQTQTFTNQSFPQMPPPPQQQQQQQHQQAIMPSQTPSPLFHQQHPPPQQQTQQQPQKNINVNNQQIFSPVQTPNLNTPQHHPQQQHETLQQQQQPPNTLIMMNRLAAATGPTTPLMQHHQPGLLQQQQLTPQNQNMIAAVHPQQQLPTNATTADVSQTPKNSGFPFENPVVAGLSYEQQMQNNKHKVGQVLNPMHETNANANANADNTPPNLHKNDLINEWDEAVLKSANSSKTNKQQDFKSSAVDTAASSATKKWSAEVNAQSPITVQQTQTQTRKNEWTASTANNSSSNNNNSSSAADHGSGEYNSDNRSDTNHWNSQDSAAYGRGNSASGNRGQGGGTNTGGYQRQRNDDRRDDRRPGGYRGRSNYGSGNPHQNGQSRNSGGSSGGIYFRNNDNNTNNNSYYHNGNGSSGGGNVYSNKDSRYDSRGNGGGNYRGPRGSDNTSNNPRNNGPPPRHMGNRSHGGNSNANNTNSNSYINSRQSSNRMPPLSVDNKN